MQYDNVVCMSTGQRKSCTTDSTWDDPGLCHGADYKWMSQQYVCTITHEAASAATKSHHCIRT